ncbi:hypothetical protein HUT18_14975 [Streptomyces sp. NA04227]|uniref:hypothetical protein n=1 Tax=Streptomyces sp. NA04227 TaxID=2742136 RepID=UPI000A206E2C|nr:hypothetical protein [Streptomyces sp. NA04227]ARM20267.1 hypothetical protein [Streptomyces sp.]QKW07492.1 hypothetical protein HUT18_14975 [Streptomyces sp. NA04227]
MGRPEAHIDPSEGPLQRFAHDLRAVRHKAGSPSYESLASRANYSGTTLAAAARGIQLPSLEVTLAYVSACDANPQPWVAYWNRTRAALAQHAQDRTRQRPPQRRVSTAGTTTSRPVRRVGGGDRPDRSERSDHAGRERRDQFAGA